MKPKRHSFYPVFIMFFFTAALMAAAPGADQAEKSPLPSPAGAKGMEKLSGPYLGQTPPGDTPQLFAPGIVSTGQHEHSAATFSPDGKEVFWSLHMLPFEKKIPSKLMVMRVVEGKWTGPVKAMVSGDHGDDSPILSPEGKTLYFASKRPAAPGEATKKKFDLWKAHKKNGRWGNPIHMGGPMSTPTHDIAASQTTSGMIYFLRGSGKKEDPFLMMRSQPVNGSYAKPERLPAPINVAEMSWTPFIAPDESYILFSSERAGGLGSLDLYVCFRKKDGAWGKAHNLGPKINTEASERFPGVSPDGKYLFFVSARLKKENQGKDLPQNGYSDIYWVDAGILNTLKACPGGR